MFSDCRLSAPSRIREISILFIEVISRETFPEKGERVKPEAGIRMSRVTQPPSGFSARGKAEA
jgi:hypothetical protein